MSETISHPTQKSGRLSYLDNLRSLVIFLVVVMHSNVTYSGMGGWYYKEGVEESLGIAEKTLFGLYGSFTQAWFMGLLFFLSAFFASRSLAKRGTGVFIRERAFRLGVPLLIYVFVVEPFIRYFLMNYGDVRSRLSFAGFILDYVTSFEWVGSTGPLWFAEALLIGCLLYAAWRAVRPANREPSDPPKTLTVILFILATGLAAFSIRLFFPIGTDVLNLQFSFFASYVALFLLGVRAGERNWLETMAERQGPAWFIAVLTAGLPAWGVIMIAGGALSGDIPMDGGLYWQSFAYAFWEAFVAIGFSFGLVGFFRKRLNIENPFTRFLSSNAFGVYVFHAPILIVFSLSLQGWQAPLLLKHAVVAPLAFTASLGFTALVRFVPGLKAVLR